MLAAGARPKDTKINLTESGGMHPQKNVFLDFGAKLIPFWHLELFPVNTDKQISHNKAPVN